MPDLGELVAALPPDTVLTDPDVLASYRQDWARDPDAGTPLAVVRANSTADVQAVLRWASAHRVPVVPRGAGSSLSGGSTAIDGGITLSLERMREVRDRPGAAGRGHPAGRVQRRGQGRGRRSRAVVSARPVLVRDLLDRRQRGDERGRAVLRQVRRHHRLRAGHGGRARRRHRAAPRRSAAQGRRRAVADEAVRRLRGHAGRDHRADAAAAARAAAGVHPGRDVSPRSRRPPTRSSRSPRRCVRRCSN